ncbi:MAG TPA: L,D-transpeptidase [Bryobacteraceae bacterium]|nr:L,D-transpeptidase [Bryobacteraceae bacterium]
MRVPGALLLLVAVAASPAWPGVRARHASLRIKPSFDTAAVNDPRNRETVTPESAGAAVVRLQILLDRAHFSPGEIDGRYGDNLRRALLGYQATRATPQTGIGDADTWQSLNADTAPALVTYTITENDVAGPFEAIPADIMEQAKLKSLGYQSPQEELGERFHIQPALLAKLNLDKDLTKAGDQILVPNIQRDYTVPAARVVVSKDNRTVSAIAADGTLLAQYPATIGSEHDPLPLGEWKITGIQHNPIFYFNPDLFWDAKPEHAKARIPAGPNSPVGVVWIGLSKEHYGIHGTADPGKIGHTESHGCIRLTNWDAAELSKMVKPGVPAILEE